MDIDGNVVNPISVYTDPILIKGLKGFMHTKPVVDNGIV